MFPVGALEGSFCPLVGPPLSPPSHSLVWAQPRLRLTDNAPLSWVFGGTWVREEVGAARAPVEASSTRWALSWRPGFEKSPMFTSCLENPCSVLVETMAENIKEEGGACSFALTLCVLGATGKGERHMDPLRVH